MDQNQTAAGTLLTELQAKRSANLPEQRAARAAAGHTGAWDELDELDEAIEAAAEAVAVELTAKLQGIAWNAMGICDTAIDAAYALVEAADAHDAADEDEHEAQEKREEALQSWNDVWAYDIAAALTAAFEGTAIRAEAGGNVPQAVLSFSAGDGTHDVYAYSEDGSEIYAPNEVYARIDEAIRAAVDDLD